MKYEELSGILKHELITAKQQTYGVVIVTRLITKIGNYLKSQDKNFKEDVWLKMCGL